jgi:hypothetical protein
MNKLDDRDHHYKTGARDIYSRGRERPALSYLQGTTFCQLVITPILTDYHKSFKEMYGHENIVMMQVNL